MVVRVEVELLDLFVGYAVDRPAPDEASEHLGEIARQSERLADFGHGPSCPVARNHSGQRAEVTAIGLVYPLDDFFAALMLEVDVDIGRLLAFAADEALEKQFMPDRVDRGD